jgi:hypothetical protein
MRTMSYSVVYDSTRTNLWWWITRSPILFVGLFLVLLILRWLCLSRRAPIEQKLLLIGVLVVVCVGAVWRLSFRYNVSRNFYLYYGPYTTIQGVVKNYEVFRTPNSVGEQFDVNDTHFGYIDLFQYKCFHNAAANGGPIHEGLQVRISYTTLHVSPCIVKLEVAPERH